MDRKYRSQAPGINALSTFSELFERYSANTNGKEQIAEYINGIGEAKPGAPLIDFQPGMAA